MCILYQLTGKLQCGGVEKSALCTPSLRSSRGLKAFLFVLGMSVMSDVCVRDTDAHGDKGREALAEVYFISRVCPCPCLIIRSSGPGCLRIGADRKAPTNK
jgi:hypothetical protein